MRPANENRPVVVGLLTVMFPAMMLVSPAAAWNLPFSSSDEPAYAGGVVRGAAGTAVVPRNSSTANARAVQQAYAENAPAGAIQQTAHTGPARSGTLLGSATPFGGTSAMPFRSTSSRPETNAKQGPSWRGHQLRMPTKLFSRGSDATRATPPAQPLPTAGPNVASSAGRMTANASPANGARPSRVASTGRPHAASASPAGRSNSPAAALPGTVTAAHSQAAAAPASFSQPHAAALLRSAPAASGSATASTTQPKTAADRLIMQAHDQAAEASREDDFTRIIETCRRGRASQPSPVFSDYANQLAAWAFNRRGQIRAESGRLKEAMLDFEDAIRANPKLWRALHNRGVLRAQAGDYELAFDDFNLTIEYNPEFAKAYSNRAALFVVAGDLPSALRDYGTAIELDPNLAVAHRGRGRVCHLLGRLDDALDHYDAAVQLAPGDAYAISSRADLLTDLGRYAEAAAGYEQAIRADARFANAYRGSAWLLATAPDSAVRNADLAVERAQKAIELDGREDAVSFDTLAAAQASAGDFTAALHTLRQAIQMAPENEREVYQDRLKLYQRAKPYRIAPLREVAQVSYQVLNEEYGVEADF